MNSATRGGTWIRRVALPLTAVAIFAAPALAQDFPEMRLTVNDLGAAGSTTGRALEAYTNAITEATGGKVTFELHMASGLLAPAEAAEGIGAGVADMGSMLTPYTPALFPVGNWMVGLGTLPKGGVPFATAYGGVAQVEYQLNTPELVDELAGVGLVMIGSAFNQAFDMLCTKPVATLADAQGKRIRTGGQLWSLEAQALGLIPVPLVPTELYEGFSRGIVDCLDLHVNGYFDFGLLDVPGKKYWTPVELAGWNASYYVMNKAKWDAMPPELQSIFRAKFPLYLETLFEAVSARHAEFAARLEASDDVEALAPDASLTDAIAKFQEGYIAGMVNNAPPTVTDPQAVIDRANASLAKWRQIALDSGLAPVPADIDERLASYANAPDLRPFLDKFAAEFAGAAQ